MRFSMHVVYSAMTALILLLGDHAFAQNFSVITDIPGCDFKTGVLTASCIPNFIAHLIQLLFSLVSIFFLINVMYAGYQIALGYIRGEKAEGIDRLRWSIIGLVISVCSFLILDLGVSIISPS